MHITFSGGRKPHEINAFNTTDLRNNEGWMKNGN